jgi:hypothetical protein
VTIGAAASPADERKSQTTLGRPETRAHREALFYSNGDDYTGREAHARADMLDMVKDQVNLMSPELDVLARELILARPTR